MGEIRRLGKSELRALFHRTLRRDPPRPAPEPAGPDNAKNLYVFERVGTPLTSKEKAIQKLLPTTGVDAETISGCFGKKNAKRTQQVAEILETLQGLGKL